MDDLGFAIFIYYGRYYRPTLNFSRCEITSRRHEVFDEPRINWQKGCDSSTLSAPKDEK